MVIEETDWVQQIRAAYNSPENGHICRRTVSSPIFDIKRVAKAYAYLLVWVGADSANKLCTQR